MWRCAHCTFDNHSGDDVCDGCEQDRVSPPPAAAATPPPSPGTAAAAVAAARARSSLPAGTWECAQCARVNESAVCGCCAAWVCAACTLLNGGVEACAACDASPPFAAAAAAALSVPPEALVAQARQERSDAQHAQRLQAAFEEDRLLWLRDRAIAVQLGENELRLA